MMSDDIPVVGIIIYFYIYIVSNTSIGLKLAYSFFFMILLNALESHLPLVSMYMCTCSRWIYCSRQACIVKFYTITLLR